MVAVIEGWSDVLQLVQHDYAWHGPWLGQLVSLLLLPFAHEDLAVILGAYVVVHHVMPVGVVTLCIYSGIIASDLALYAVGAAARRSSWLARLAVDDRVVGSANILKNNLLGLVALGRVVPGIAVTAFVACGWMRVPLVRFVATSLIVSALYLPLMLCIAVVFGGALHQQVGSWTWPFLVAVVMAMGYFRQRVFGLQETAEPSEAAPSSDALRRRGERRMLTPAVYAWSRPRRRSRPQPGTAVTGASASRV